MVFNLLLYLVLHQPTNKRTHSFLHNCPWRSLSIVWIIQPGKWNPNSTFVIITFRSHSRRWCVFFGYRPELGFLKVNYNSNRYLVRYFEQKYCTQINLRSRRPLNTAEREKKNWNRKEVPRFLSLWTARLPSTDPSGFDMLSNVYSIWRQPNKYRKC